MDYKITEEEFQRARKHHNRGETLMDARHYDKAIDAFSTAISIFPEWGSAYINRGLAYYYLRRYKEALNDCNRAVQLDPKASAYYNRALVFIDTGDQTNALSDLSMSIVLDPKPGLAYLNRGLLRIQFDQVELGMADLARAKQLQPELIPYIDSEETKSLIHRHTEREARQRSAANTASPVQLGPKPMMKVVHSFDLLRAGRFVRRQECNCVKDRNSEHVTITVSHRWNEVSNPDRSGIQYHGVIRFIIQACMMAMRSTPNVFNAVDFSEVIVCPSLFTRLVALYEQYESEVVHGAGPEAMMQGPLGPRIIELFQYMERTIGSENTRLVALDIPALAYMMGHFDVWYDYTCMYQEKREGDEKEIFEQELQVIDRYFADCWTLINWSKSDLNRAWCILEAAVAHHVGKMSFFSAENSKVSSSDLAPINQMFFGIQNLRLNDLVTDLREVIPSYGESIRKTERIGAEILRHFNREVVQVDLTNDLTTPLYQTLVRLLTELRGRSASDIRAYLVEHGYDCTREQDLDVIADRFAALYSG